MNPHSEGGHLNSARAGNCSGLNTVPVPIWKGTSRPPTIQLAVMLLFFGVFEALSSNRKSAHWPVPPEISEAGADAGAGEPGNSCCVDRSCESDTAVLPPAPGH